MEIRLNWTDFKVRLEKIFYTQFQYIENGKDYILFINDSFNQYICHMNKTTPPSSGQIDFETNYKSSGDGIMTT